MLKVMHVLNSNKYSGAENVVISAISLMKDVIDGTYVSIYGPIKEYLIENNIKYVPVKKLSYLEMQRAIKIVQPDIIHAHDFTAGIISTVVGRGIPVINHLHNNAPWVKSFNFRSVIYAISCFKYSKILTVSDAIMDEYVFGKYFKYKAKTIENPIDLSMIHKMSGNPIIKYDIAFLGRLSTAKNPYLFLDIVTEIKKKKNNISAIMIGDGELMAGVRRMIDKNDLKNNVRLVGFQKNPYVFLNQAKLLCMPSLWEGYGLAALEALALGKPVICSGVGGLAYIVDETCGGICRNMDEYVMKILHLLENVALLTSLSKNAWAIARAKSKDIHTYCNDLLQTYIQV